MPTNEVSRQCILQVCWWMQWVLVKQIMPQLYQFMPVMHRVYQLLLLTYPQVHQYPPHQKNLIRAWGMPLQICYATRADDPVKDFVEEKRAASLDASMSKCWINPVVACSTLSHITSQHKSNHTGRKHNYEVFWCLLLEQSWFPPYPS